MRLKIHELQGHIFDSSYIDLLLMLRYGSKDVCSHVQPVLNYKSIAKLLHKSESTIAHQCKLALKLRQENLQAKQKRKSKFTQEHIDYLIDSQTLKYWAHFSLEFRAVMFHRKFPQLKISPQTIANIYKRNGISYKTINRVKRVIDFTIPFYRNNLIFVYEQMQRALANNIKFIHADECVFTFSTFMNRSWYKKYDNIEVYDKKVKVITHALLAGISEEAGLEAYVIHPRSIKTQQYIEFLEKLRAKYVEKEIILFVDNLSVHKTKETKKAYDRLNITPVYNVPYSPEFNGIEFYWGLVKSHYKKLLLYHLMHDLPIDTVDFIVSAMKRVNKEKTTISARQGRINVEKKFLSLSQ